MDRNENDEIKQHLMQTSEEFRALAQRHQELDAEVAALDDTDEIQEHRLKKLKLHLKDQMVAMMSRGRTQHA